MTFDPSSQSLPASPAHHFPLGSQERYIEDKKLSLAKQREIEAKLNEKLKRECTFAPAVSSACSSQLLAARAADVVARLQQSDVNRRQRLEDALKASEATKLVGLTFRPEINPISARTAAAMKNISSVGGGGGAENDSYTSDRQQNLHQNPNTSQLSAMKVEDRLLREGRLAEARRSRMKEEMEKQEMALLNVGRSSSSNHDNRSRKSGDEGGGGDGAGDDGQEAEDDESSSTKPLWQRLQESDKLARENRERLRMYLENQYTFKPSINHVSAATVTLSREHEQEHQQNQQQNQQSPNPSDVVHRLYDASIRQRSEKMRERQEEEIKQQSRQYTFAPRVSLRSAQLAVRRAASLGSGNGNGNGGGGGGGSFAQRQQHAEACRQENISVMKEALHIQEEKETMNHKFGGFGRHLDPLEMSNHVKRMVASAQQKTLKLKELAERSTATECPFQPVTTRKSSEIVAKKFSHIGFGGFGGDAGRGKGADVVERMEMERKMMLMTTMSRRQPSSTAVEDNNNNNTSSASNNDTSGVSANRRTSTAMSASRLHDFLEAQDEHVRRKEAKVLELRHQLAYSEIAECTFRPETNLFGADPHHHHQAGAAAGTVASNTSFSTTASSAALSSINRHRSASSNTSHNNDVVDEKVRGMDVVRARVALAAKLKQEQAEREAKAWGIVKPAVSVSQQRRRSSSAGSVPRCAVSSFDYHTSTSQQRQRKVTTAATESALTKNERSPSSNSSVQIRSSRNNNYNNVDDEQEEDPETTVVLVDSNSRHLTQHVASIAAAVDSDKKSKAEAKRASTTKKQKQQQQKTILEDDELEEVEYSQQQHQNYRHHNHHKHNHRDQVQENDVDVDDDEETPSKMVPRQRLARDVMKGAGLLPQHLLEQYEKQWMSIQKQQQEQEQERQQQHQSGKMAKATSSSLSAASDSAAAASAAVALISASKTSTPRMSLKKKPQNIHYEGGGNGQEQHQQQGQESTAEPSSTSPYRKKSAAFDLALRRHLSSDAAKNQHH